MAVSAPRKVLAEVDLSDASKGMWRAGSRETPPKGSWYDITNGLIQADGRVFRRGGSTSKSSSSLSGAGMVMVWDGAFNVGNRTVFANANILAVLAANDSTPVIVASSMSNGTAPIVARKVGNYLAIPTTVSGAANVLTYGGSRKGANYTTGTVSVTNGSRTLTGVGTTWIGNVDAGMILFISGKKRAMVQSVDSNTQITLDDNWADTTVAGSAYSLQPTLAGVPNNAPTPTATTKIASIANRIAYAAGNQVGLSDIYDPFSYTPSNFLRFPGTVLALANVRETLLVFHTGGVHAIGGLANATPSDAAGNANWSYQLANPELIAFGHEGIASWGGRALVPALDGIWLVDPTSGPQRISDNIRDYWLSLARTTGYVPGGAAVHAGHYFLPILDSASSYAWVDTLVCRLDTQAWTHLAGNGAKMNVFGARRSNPPQLMGGDLSGGAAELYLLPYLEPSTAVKNDHDGTAHVLDLTTQDIQGPGDQVNLFERIRAWWTGTVDSGSPTVGATAQRLKDGSPTTLQGSSGATYSAVSDGSAYSWWQVAKMGKQIRFRITTSGSLSTFVLNKLIALILPSAGE